MIRVKCSCGRNLAVRDSLAGKWFSVVDGNEDERYDRITDLTFSPNSKRFAYTAERAGKIFVVIDRKEITDFEESSLPVFSPDSRWVAFPALSKGGAMHIFQLGPGDQARALAARGKIGLGTVVYSHESSRVAYAARKGKKWVIVEGGEESNPYDKVGRPYFSPDSKHVAFAARQGKQTFMVLDGIEGKPWNAIYMGSSVFVGDDRLQYAALEGSKLYRVEQGIEE